MDPSYLDLLAAGAQPGGPAGGIRLLRPPLTVATTILHSVNDAPGPGPDHGLLDDGDRPSAQDRASALACLETDRFDNTGFEHQFALAIHQTARTSPPPGRAD